MEMPAPDAGIIERKDRIVSLLAMAAPNAAVIHDPAETPSLRVRCADGLHLSAARSCSADHH